MLNAGETTMTNRNFKKPLAIAVGALAGSLAAASVANANPFSLTALGNAYMQATESSSGAKAAEGKCGEGKCGANMKGEGDKAKEGKCGEGKCGADKAKEGSCGGDKAKEGKCGAEKKDG
jgi:uncharacterized low-complexity protein